MKRFFVKDTLKAGKIELLGQEAHHLQNVMRLKIGATCELVNDKRQTAPATVLEAEKGRVVMEICEVAENTQHRTCIYIYQGYLKDSKLDELVRPLSELGVYRFTPVLTQRAVPAPDTVRLAKRHERWQKLAVEALKQHGDGDLMQVGDVLPFAEALKQASLCDLKLFFWEEDHTSLKSFIEASLQVKNVSSIAVFLGPEGGFEAKETQLAQSCGFTVLSLGPRILRAQTAPIAVAAILQYLFGDIG